MKPAVLMRRIVESVCFFVRRMLAPSFCISCRLFPEKQQVSFLCDNCLAQIKPVVSVELPASGNMRKQRKSVRVFALSDYRDPLKSLIRAKNHGNILAARQLGIVMGKLLPATSLECDCLVPVPLHPTRYARRGFNQSKIIAETLGKILNKPVVDCLKKIKRTPFQARLNAHARKENTRNVFRCTKTAASLKNKHIVIIDDLMTTGATLVAAGKELRSVRPASIKACVACRAL